MVSPVEELAIMKPIKIRVLLFLPILLLLTACVNNQSDTGTASLEETVMTEFTAINFNELDEFARNFFQGFDPAHIYNFHYADVTSDWSESRIPAPTDPRIQGFFNIAEESWDHYVNESDSWRGLALNALTTQEDGIRAHGHGLDSAPDVFEVDINQLDWVESTSFTDRHRGERIGGSFLICKENRLVWFHLSRT